jgi:hypothetical protein
MKHSLRLTRCALAAAVAAGLAACGGGGGGETVAPAASCSVADQKAWLASYMDDWYFWYRLSPRLAPDASPTVDAYFKALLYTGTDSRFPADRWSGYQSTESYNRFFGDGQTLGYGVSVAGLEVTGQPDAPLYVRYVEARSPAAAAGVQRGDEVLSINGRSSAELIAANDFGALTSTTAGQTLTLSLRRNGSTRSVTVSSAIYALTPVPAVDAVFTTPGNRRLGYVLVKDMVSQATAPLEAAFARFRAQGVGTVVLDLRYNGGGLVSVGGTVASYVAGSTGAGRNYATLLYNDKRAGANNQSFAFTQPPSAITSTRVYVLTGERTCSASEQLINGLRGVGVEVVAIGDTTCGKPVGFVPASSCGNTYSVVNFESVNARNEGRYFDGLDASCPVAEDFTKPLGDRSEPLLNAALVHADTGACPRSGPAMARAQRAQGTGRVLLEEGDTPRQMVGR